ncbi:MAG: SDR family oxidoreductase [Bacteroidales bacterium]
MSVITNQSKKLALVTGGASGLGLAISQKFISRGIETLLLGRDKKKLEEACNKLGSLAHPLAFDLVNTDQIPAMVTQITRELGPLNILVNNAGLHLKKDFFEHADKDFLDIQHINQLAVFALSREVAKTMAGRGGSILNISSMASQYGIPKVIAYTASKSAVEGMTRALAVELAPLGIRVNCIAPGFIVTDMSSGALEKDAPRKQKVLSRTPLGRLGTTDEVAEAAYFLVSDAASFITGVVLPVDGGNSIGF